MAKATTKARKRIYRQVARAEASAETEQRILEAATALFAERYYDEVSLDDIAEQAGVATKTVMRRFGTKEMLAARFIEAASRHNGAARDAVPPGDVDAAIRMILELYEVAGDMVLRILSLDGRIPMVTAMADEGRRLHSVWVARVFDPLLRSEGTRRTNDLALLIVATDVYTWKILRRDRKLTAAQTALAIRQLIDRCLAPSNN